MWYYVLLSVASLLLAALSGPAYMVNLLTYVAMQLAAPVVILLQREPHYQGFSAMSAALTISLLWPLTLAPLHWLTCRALTWNGWMYAGLIIGTAFVIAFVVLLATSNAR